MDQSGGGRKTRNPAPINARPAFPTSRRGLLRAGAAALGLVLPGAGLAQSVDVRGRGYDPLWRDAEDAIAAFLGPGPYLRTGARLTTPEYVDSGASVPISVEIDSAMSAQDYPRVAHVVAHSNPNPQVVSVWFTPEGGRAAFSTRIRLERSQRITLVVQMNDGRLLRHDVDVEIAIGACADDGTGTIQDVTNFSPRSRVSAPAQARAGEIVTLRALISHPMETGLRLDELDDWVRQRIISSFSCTYDGKPLFRARLYPSVAANPFFEFHCRATHDSSLDFAWYDTQDLTFVNQARLKVV